MLILRESLSAWGSTEFEIVLKREIAGPGVKYLPLQQGLSGSSYVSESPVTVNILQVGEDKVGIQVKVGIFYQGIIAGCSCADDPTPVNEINEYCELLLHINMLTGEASIVLLD